MRFCFPFMCLLDFLSISPRYFENRLIKLKDIPVIFAIAVIKLKLDELQITFNRKVYNDSFNVNLMWVDRSIPIR